VGSTYPTEFVTASVRRDLKVFQRRSWRVLNMKITRKHITILLVTALLASFPCLIPLSYGETRSSDDGKHVASVTVRRVGVLGLFNRFDRVTFRLANSNKTIVSTKEFSGGELDDPEKIVDRSKVFIKWNGESVKISDAWNRSIVWNVQDN
jgi:hypothetical protein